VFVFLAVFVKKDVLSVYAVDVVNVVVLVVDCVVFVFRAVLDSLTVL